MLAQDISTIHDTQFEIEGIKIALAVLKEVLHLAYYEGEMVEVEKLLKNISKLENKLNKAYAKQEKAYHNLLVLYL